MAVVANYVWCGGYSVHVSYPGPSSSSSSATWHIPSKASWRRRSSSLLCCRCTNPQNNSNSINGGASSSTTNSSADWDWNRWTRHFSDIQHAETLSSVLKSQLGDAIEREDFQEAAKLKRALVEATSKDCVAEIMSQLKDAINEERYLDASQLCKCTGSGLVGWWAGFSKDSDDPFGRIVHVSPGVGRFVGRSYSPKYYLSQRIELQENKKNISIELGLRVVKSTNDLNFIYRQLATASPGTPLFEIYVVKDADDAYTLQVVFLRRVKESVTNPSGSSSDSKFTKGTSTSEIEDLSIIDIDSNDTKTDKSEDKSFNIEAATEEGIKSVLNYLKDKIPELKLNVMKVKVSEEVIEDVEAIKQLIQEDDESTTDEDSEEDDEDSNLDNIQPDQISLEENNDDTVVDEKILSTKVFIGGVLHEKDDSPTKHVYMRMPAEIKDVERDSFVLHVAPRSRAPDDGEIVVPKVKVAAVAPKGLSELMPPAVAKAFSAPTSDKISAKVSRDVREIIKRAVVQAQKREKLSEFTSFSRIATSDGDLDPFEGLYVGAFGPYGAEVVQLKRKYGNWKRKDDDDDSSEVEFFEYVEAVKLTGDLNVPAGQVTFRAKIGKANRSSNRGLYPDELGVVASFKGQGMIAEFGFKNPKWVEGELLQLNGKGMVPYVKGADLGFLYVVPEQSFLVLFNRLRLPN